MNISYEEIGHMSVTFPAGGCTVGTVCKLDADGKAAACSAGDAFCGAVEAVRGTQAGVQIHGFVKIGYSGTAPSCGFANLAADGNGGVAVADGGKSYLVVKVDAAAKTIVMEL